MTETLSFSKFQKYSKSAAGKRFSGLVGCGAVMINSTTLTSREMFASKSSTVPSESVSLYSCVFSPFILIATLSIWMHDCDTSINCWLDKKPNVL